VKDSTRVATGLRHALGLAWSRDANAMFVVSHGRDQLDTFWPKLYTAKDNAELPAEEMHKLTPNLDGGWPYTYWDPIRNRRVMAPEYGGDRKAQPPKGKYADPMVAFPAHWAPNALTFYEGKQFPANYHGGAFIAFHGSWNRAPEPQRGYNVVFVPMQEGRVSGPWRVFADGFAGKPEIRSPREAVARPMGVAVAPDGSLYIADSVQGRIWRVRYAGK
jgi:glucose/arabinose dehydrogenase